MTLSLSKSADGFAQSSGACMIIKSAVFYAQAAISVSRLLTR